MMTKWAKHQSLQKYQDNAEVKLDDEVEALLATEQPKAMMLPLLTQFRLLSLKKQPDQVNLDDIEIPDITGADSKVGKAHVRVHDCQE